MWAKFVRQVQSEKGWLPSNPVGFLIIQAIPLRFPDLVGFLVNPVGFLVNQLVC